MGEGDRELGRDPSEEERKDILVVPKNYKLYSWDYNVGLDGSICSIISTYDKIFKSSLDNSETLEEGDRFGLENGEYYVESKEDRSHHGRIKVVVARDRMKTIGEEERRLMEEKLYLELVSEEDYEFDERDAYSDYDSEDYDDYDDEEFGWTQEERDNFNNGLAELERICMKKPEFEPEVDFFSYCSFELIAPETLVNVEEENVCIDYSYEQFVCNKQTYDVELKEEFEEKEGILKKFLESEEYKQCLFMWFGYDSSEYLHRVLSKYASYKIEKGELVVIVRSNTTGDMTEFFYSYLDDPIYSKFKVKYKGVIREERLRLDVEDSYGHWPICEKCDMNRLFKWKFVRFKGTEERIYPLKLRYVVNFFGMETVICADDYDTLKEYKNFVEALSYYWRCPLTMNKSSYLSGVGPNKFYDVIGRLIPGFVGMKLFAGSDCKIKFYPPIPRYYYDLPGDSYKVYIDRGFDRKGKIFRDPVLYDFSPDSMLTALWLRGCYINDDLDYASIKSLVAMDYYRGAPEIYDYFSFKEEWKGKNAVYKMFSNPSKPRDKPLPDFVEICCGLDRMIGLLVFLHMMGDYFYGDFQLDNVNFLDADEVHSSIE